ncbi:hydroxylamine reductase [Pontiella sulfatireligans]|uniref:Hydroxylamine reductase n=1 Tax=Pontiella sulfatireligans TaxID=2750658 RepID=A0A6C2USZ9_9BACT|nr:hydroxylamine reductase [Pontiella sulfatireligans]VGO23398.1 Hydroxylamine reductase [Pontiella sulfatireligans]
MFCYQCQETAKNEGCTMRGVCGKSGETSDLQDLLIYLLKGISIKGEKAEMVDRKAGRFIAEGLFATITNANFDNDRFAELIQQALKIRHAMPMDAAENLHDSVTWTADGMDAFLEKAKSVGVLATENEDIRSLRELVVYGLKGLAAYAEHAAVLDFEDDVLYAFMMEALASTTRDLSVDELVALTMKTGEMGVKTMAILDQANTETYGNPEMTEVNIGAGSKPGILISGHDLKDMEELLEQTQGTGVDVYTHGEMLPANYYPAFKKYDHFHGNYGNAWWKQGEEFTTFNGPILMTTNCIVPVKEAYKDRIYTTNTVGYPGVAHIADRPEDGKKDFSAIVEQAKTCAAPVEIETGTITGGFAHHQVMQLADKVVDAVKSGAIKRFVVMAGCDGRHKTRDYYKDVAETLPKDTVILTAGCAKYRYNKLELGDIGGIPRVLDAGQCNDSYSLAVIAMKLQEVFGLDDINDLPISYDIAWYEQKAVIVLLALLFLGVKGIRLGPTLPAFLSANVVKVLVDNFDIKPIGEVEADVAAMMEGK